MKELTDQDLKGILRAIASVSSPDILLGFARAAIAADRALNAPADRDVMRQAVNALLNQIDIGDFVDSHGHSAKMLKPVHDLMQMLSVPTPPAEQPTKVETTYARQHAAHEAELTAMIEERDHREEIIDQLCDAVLGPDRAEWSSNYYFEDAVSEVQERIAELETRKECRKSNMPAEQQEPAHDVLATLRAEVEGLTQYDDGLIVVGALHNVSHYDIWFKNQVLALIDKMGGKV